MSLIFNMVSRLVITLLPRSKRLLISWLQSPSAVILGPKNVKFVTIPIVSRSICHEVMGPDAMIMTNAGLDEAQAGIKIARRNINNLRYADDPTLMAESEEEQKSLLMKVKVESENVGLKLNIQKMKIMASGPITSLEIDGETVSDFILGGSKITADGDFSHEIKRRLILGRKVIPT